MKKFCGHGMWYSLWHSGTVLAARRLFLHHFTPKLGDDKASWGFELGITGELLKSWLG